VFLDASRISLPLNLNTLMLSRKISGDKQKREVMFLKIVTFITPQENNPLIYKRIIAEHFKTGKIHVSHYLYFNSMKIKELNASVSISRGASREFTIPYLSSA
jgi:hypothetical protein